MEIKGLDVSSYQGKIHWPQVAEAGCRYGVLRSIRRKSTRLNSSHSRASRMPSSA